MDLENIWTQLELNGWVFGHHKAGDIFPDLDYWTKDEKILKVFTQDGEFVHANIEQPIELEALSRLM